MASFSPALPDLSGYSLPNQTVDRFTAQNFRFSEAQKPADYFSGKLFEQPTVFIRHSRYKSSIRRQPAAPSASSRIGFIRALQRKLRHRNRRLGQQTHILLQRRYTRLFFGFDARTASFCRIFAASTVGESAMRSSSPSSASKPAPSASRCRTDKQSAANRTSTAPRISIPITSSSFLRQKAPQAGIKHASAPALRKHMP